MATPIKKNDTPRATLQAAMMEAEKRREEGGIVLDGRKYLSVRERVDIFRKFFAAEYGILTEVKCPDPMISKGTPVIAYAQIREVATGNVVASGTAMEYVGSSTYTRTSPFEVAETSAIGRALAVFGLHGGEFASANEIVAAKSKPAIGKEVVSPEVKDLDEMIRDIKNSIDNANDMTELAVLHASLMGVVDKIDEPARRESFKEQINSMFRLRVSFLTAKQHKEQQENVDG